MREIRLSILVLSLAFLAGSIGGNLAAMLLADGQSLADYAQTFLDGAESGALDAAAAGALAAGLALPMIVFLSGFSSIGVAIIPACIAFKGFTFSYAVSAMFRSFGPDGAIFTFCALGTVSLLYVPCLLFSALFAFRSSAVLASVFFGKSQQSGTGRIAPIYYIQFAVSTAVISALAVYQAFLQPRLLEWAASSLP